MLIKDKMEITLIYAIPMPNAGVEMRRFSSHAGKERTATVEVAAAVAVAAAILSPSDHFGPW